MTKRACLLLGVPLAAATTVGRFALNTTAGGQELVPLGAREAHVQILSGWLVLCRTGVWKPGLALIAYLNGSTTTMVSSRSGLVEMICTGHPVNASMRSR